MQDINAIRYESGDQVWHSADNPKYSLELVSGNAFDITVACIITNATGVRFTRKYADGSFQFERVCVLNINNKFQHQYIYKDKLTTASSILQQLLRKT